MLARHLLAVSAVFSFVLTLQGQIASQKQKAPIDPLPGYTWSGQDGKDGISGKFVRADGFAITFRRSAAKGFYSKGLETEKVAVWRKDQIVNGSRVAVARFEDGKIAALIDDTEMLSANARTLEQMADLLLSIGPLSQQNDSSGPAPVRPSASCNMRLLPGYVHEPRQGVDSSPGVIAKEGGLSIRYDIGKMAANYAIQYFPVHFERLRRRTHLNADANEADVRYLSDQVRWRQRRNVNGDELMLVQLKDNKLIGSFAKASANFLGKVDSVEEMVDFLLTVLTYCGGKRLRPAE